VLTTDILTPDAMLAKHIMTAADSNKDGVLSQQEVSDFLEKNFAQWDSNGNGSLDAQEFGAAFGPFVMPDEFVTPPPH
jgi:hypothetical protein